MNKIKITNKLVEKFANQSGDFNPIHLNENYSVTSLYGKRIAHGALVLNLIRFLIMTSFLFPIFNIIHLNKILIKYINIFYIFVIIYSYSNVPLQKICLLFMNNNIPPNSITPISTINSFMSVYAMFYTFF